MKDPVISLDIETLDTANSAVILSIGAVEIFSGEKFYNTCEPAKQLAAGRTLSRGTLDFWIGQGVAFTELLDECNLVATTLSFVLSSLRTFVERFPEAHIYTRGSMDINVLEHAFGKLGRPAPWQY